ncbi:MAG: Holliday junction resolvase RuvX [Bacteroidaceae bacterium]|jgi:putative Holliday junction resolvase|nr:Holliday junction resolvase RuvX [Bacteroidaceae bacterium]
MGRILSIDYGQKRTGIAVTDTLQMIANGLTTVETKQLEAFLVDYMKKEDVETIVVGLPKQTNGEDSENMKRITPFVNRIKKLFPDKKIEMYDERFTSVLAHQTMLSSGIGKKARQDKGLVDKISATIILEDYMESKRLL